MRRENEGGKETYISATICFLSRSLMRSKLSSLRVIAFSPAVEMSWQVGKMVMDTMDWLEWLMTVPIC